MRRLLTPIVAVFSAMHLLGCSWTVPFYIINDGAVPRQIEIQLSKEKDTFLIFDPRHFTVLPWDADGPDYEKKRELSQPWRASLTIEIPPHSALRIGYLSNDKYENNRQQFINGRVFNLVRLKAGQTEVTRETFDRYFRKTSAGVVWELPD